MKINRRYPFWLFAGDVLALLLVSIIGFATHNQSISWRVLTTFLPYVAAWFLFAPWLGVYHRSNTIRYWQVWRPMLAALLAAPMAAWLRGVWLNSAILPIFVLVLGLSAALGFGIWRLVWSFISQRVGQNG
jgi:hypothetical protein